MQSLKCRRHTWRTGSPNSADHRREISDPQLEHEVRRPPSPNHAPRSEKTPMAIVDTSQQHNMGLGLASSTTPRDINKQKRHPYDQQHPTYTGNIWVIPEPSTPREVINAGDGNVEALTQSVQESVDVTNALGLLFERKSTIKKVLQYVDVYEQKVMTPRRCKYILQVGLVDILKKKHTNCSDAQQQMERQCSLSGCVLNPRSPHKRCGGSRGNPPSQYSAAEMVQTLSPQVSRPTQRVEHSND